MRIACVLADDFEDSEYQVPSDAFRDAGHQVIVIGAKKGQTLTGKKSKAKVIADLGIDEVKPDQFDALFIPGGYSPDHLRADERFVDFVRGFEEKPMLAICHGPQLLSTADMLDGRELTAWQTVQGDLEHTGAIVLDEEVVVDDNLVTSRQPSDLPAFVRESLRLLSQPYQQPMV